MRFSKKVAVEENSLGQPLIDALNNAQAMVWFDLSGKITDANQNFLDALGYSADEIVGKHHQTFVSPDNTSSEDFKALWARLASGKTVRGDFKQVHKSGRDVWLEASYSPLFDKKGAVVAVVEFAVDVTEQKQKQMDQQHQLAAISRAQAVIEFDLDGIVLKANETFCKAMGYDESEIIGKHHALFVEDEYAASTDYSDFWASFEKSACKSAEYAHVAKNGHSVWFQASYNSIKDANGKPYKVINYATDITQRKVFMDALTDGLSKLSDGDLTPRMNKGNDPALNALPEDLSSASDAFNATMDRLTHMTQEIQSSSGAVSNSIKSIAENAQELAQRTEQQAASLEETNAAVEEISSNITLTASNAKKANSAAQGAEERALQGDNVVQSAISAMDRIEDGSKKITEIISVIESISFQTNLLALNAAVEAARAGESGKGFAVVASEVRILAQRSSEAAQDITQLIESSSAQVVEGAGLVRSTGDMLQEIKSSIELVVGNVNEISDASSQQADRLRGISEAISGIDNNTQGNAQMAQVSVAGAQNLEKESDHLLELASFFASNQPSPSVGVDLQKSA